jgi:[acyl-carrier-protein] S-malonyltransferase
MIETNPVLIFPAFGEKLLDKDIIFFQQNNLFFKKYFVEAFSLLKLDFCNFIMEYDNILKNELYSQYLTYIFSCVVTDLYKQQNVMPIYLSGYSLGLYAALYSASAINFKDGLILIRKIYHLIEDEIKDRNYGIAVIIGLEYPDLVKIIKQDFKNIEIINQNNKYSFVISGDGDEIRNAVQLCINEGGTNSRLLSISSPYHSIFVHRPADIFEQFIQQEIKIVDLKIPIISTVDQRIILNKNEAMKELTMNIKHNINWHATMKKLLTLNVKLFIECGIGKSLIKIGKFIEGDYKINTF